MPDDSEKPVGFASRTLTKAEQNYSHLDKEALAIIYGVKKYHQYLYGRQFQIKTDHKPLTHIFSESRAVPTMASGRIQRWALTLGAYDYRIKYRQGKANANADALSRLPLPSAVQEVLKPAEVVHLVEHLATTPVSSTQIKSWTDTDPTLSKVRHWVQDGWPDADEESDEKLSPYLRRRLELSMEGGCVLWGCRVVIPVKGRERVMEMLHEAHPGIARMKSLARSYFWWPGMDREIEQCVKRCTVCQSSRKDPPVAPLHAWSWPEKPWTRVHIDYAGPMEGKMFLVIVDAHSKWMDIHITNSSTSSVTIELLRKTFAALGLPEVVVSDNATTFTSTEFSDFLKRNGVRHVRTPPYHPASNGLAERAVQTFKEAMKRIKGGSLNTRLPRFLFRYRMTSHTSTQVSPAELMFGRKLRSHLDLLRPSTGRTVRQAQDQQKKNHDVRSQSRSFVIGESVYARNYGQGSKWLPGSVIETEGSVLFRVCLTDGRIICRHVDQLRSRIGVGGPSEAQEELVDGPSQVNPTGDAAEEVERRAPEPDSIETSPGTQTPDLATTSTEGPRVAEGSSDFERLETDLDAAPEQTSQTGESQPLTFRRSTRVKHSPLRFEKQFC